MLVILSVMLLEINVRIQKNRCVHFDVTMFTHKTMRSDLSSEKEKNIIQTIQLYIYYASALSL